MTGNIIIYPKTTVPAGFLLCDGSAVSRTTYAALFDLIGTTYGIGDNSTTFNVPDLKGKTIFGKSAETEFDTLGKTGGAKTANLLHGHTMNAHSHTGSMWTGGPSSTKSGDYTPTEQTVAEWQHTHSGTASIGSSSDNTAANALSSTQSILSSYITFSYLIKI